MKTYLSYASLLILGASVLVSASLAQVTPSSKNRAPNMWFYGRVVSTEPPVLEIVDDWLGREGEMQSLRYELRLEYPIARHWAQDFELGDIVLGKYCYPAWSDECSYEPETQPYPDRPYECKPAMRPVLIGLRKLPETYKAKYRFTGTLISYRPADVRPFQQISVFRDGRIGITAGMLSSVWRRLSVRELKDLEQAFFNTRRDKTDSTVQYPSTGITTTFDRLRQVALTYGEKVDYPFLEYLDRIAADQIGNADYRLTYRWRFQIQNWQFGHIIPLDEAAKPGYEFMHRNREQLSRRKVPISFFRQARDPINGVSPYIYRYKGRLYRFTFGYCPFDEDGTWACHIVGEVGKGDSNNNVIGPFDEWPRQLRTRLRDVRSNQRLTDEVLYPKGASITRADFKKNYAFYSTVRDEGGWYGEGQYVYADVMVWFR